MRVILRIIDYISYHLVGDDPFCITGNDMEIW
jgi:hypothetical protein